MITVVYKSTRMQTYLKSRRGDLEVLADIVAVEHGVDIGEVDLLVSELTTLL